MKKILVIFVLITSSLSFANPDGLVTSVGVTFLATRIMQVSKAVQQIAPDDVEEYRINGTITPVLETLVRLSAQKNKLTTQQVLAKLSEQADSQ
jgi:hypothetical protein